MGAVDDSPDGQFGADIVGRADEASFCERSTEYHELAKTNRAGFFCDPSEDHHGLASVQSIVGENALVEDGNGAP